ncbi:hypothetical protein DUNSADRAFT_8474 [Dunaliella salina]|uniref:Uncharacterized protein n=1 Tax=Dunaliella salina TaxID=3046 RepID=A0ABQ7GJF6_DUNSA|nr:hypothetical protein DUNSADRAFT_8474 [Dunaliella salina]|eukprot:KAF5834747.1 hypothetical protein DUNSADRAFT_8474 [Dunaliella salina]
MSMKTFRCIPSIMNPLSSNEQTHFELNLIQSKRILKYDNDLQSKKYSEKTERARVLRRAFVF